MQRLDSWLQGNCLTSKQLASWWQGWLRKVAVSKNQVYSWLTTLSTNRRVGSKKNLSGQIAIRDERWRALHMSTRGVWGHAPPGKLLFLRLLLRCHFHLREKQVRHINEKITTVFIPHSFQKQISTVFQHSVPWLVEPVSNATHNFLWGGLTELASFHMTLRLVGYFTNLNSAIHNSTASMCSKFKPCMVVLALLHVRVWLHETSFHEWQHARYNF